MTVLAAFRPRSTYWATTANPRRCFGNSCRLDKEEKKQTTADIDKIPSHDPNDPLANPLLESYLAKHEPGKKPKRPEPPPAKLSTGSIFKEEYEIPGWRDNMDPAEKQRLRDQHKEQEDKIKAQQEMDNHALLLDPAPHARRHLERKLVIKNAAKRGRVTKAVKLMRTERQSLYKSHFLPTSVKKLTQLMNQIQGKTVEEALIQLRFSKKLVARDVLKGLKAARDRAVAAHGMGLGSQFLADGTRRAPREGSGVQIELKGGGKKTVFDPTEIYIDQAWVGRGDHTKEPEYRARGRMNVLKHPTTSEWPFYPVLGTAGAFADPLSVCCVAQGRKDSNAHLGRNPEEAGQPQAVAASPGSTGHRAEAVLFVVMYLDKQRRRTCIICIRLLCDRIAFASQGHVQYTICADMPNAFSHHPKQNMLHPGIFMKTTSRLLFGRKECPTPSLCRKRPTHNLLLAHSRLFTHPPLLLARQHSRSAYPPYHARSTLPGLCPPPSAPS